MIIYCSIVLSFDRSIVRSFHCSIVPLFQRSIVPLFQRSIVPLFHCYSTNCQLSTVNCPTVQLSNCPTVQLSNCPTVQLKKMCVGFLQKRNRLFIMLGFGFNNLKNGKKTKQTFICGLFNFRNRGVGLVYARKYRKYISIVNKLLIFSHSK
jgi:hypothetical protein